MRVRGHAVLVVALSCRAATVLADEARPRALPYDLRVDVPLTAGLGIGFIVTEILRGRIAPVVCRWCDRSADGADALNGLDRGVRGALRWSDTGTADLLSNLTGYVLAPAAALGVLALSASHDGALGSWPVDALIVLEAVAVSAALTQTVKFLAGRERPFVHGAAGGLVRSSDDNLSFYSGHTSLAFSVAVASGTVATLRGYSCYACSRWIRISRLGRTWRSVVSPS